MRRRSPQKPQSSAGLEQDRAFREQGLQELQNLQADPESIEEFLAWRRHRERQRMPLEAVSRSKGSPAKSSSPATKPASPSGTSPGRTTPSTR